MVRREEAFREVNQAIALPQVEAQVDSADEAELVLDTLARMLRGAVELQPQCALPQA